MFMQVAHETHAQLRLSLVDALDAGLVPHNVPQLRIQHRKRILVICIVRDELLEFCSPVVAQNETSTGESGCRSWGPRRD